MDIFSVVIVLIFQVQVIPNKNGDVRKTKNEFYRETYVKYVRSILHLEKTAKRFKAISKTKYFR